MSLDNRLNPEIRRKQLEKFARQSREKTVMTTILIDDCLDRVNKEITRTRKNERHRAAQMVREIAETYNSTGYKYRIFMQLANRIENGK